MFSQRESKGKFSICNIANDAGKTHSITQMRVHHTSLLSIIPFPPAKQTWRGFRDFETGTHCKPDEDFALGIRKVLERGLAFIDNPCGVERKWCG